MKTLELEGMGLESMTNFECETLEGGCGWYGYCADVYAAALIDTWDALASGFKSGYDNFNSH